MRVKVLVVEDDETTRNVLEQILSQDEAFDVEMAPDGSSGLRVAQRGGVDVVVLDYRLPEMTGLEVLEHLRALEDPPAVVFLTGEGDETVAYRALSEGAVDYLVKDVETYRELPGLVRDAHDAWSSLERVVQPAIGSRGTIEQDRVDHALSEGGLGRFLERGSVQGLVVHDPQGRLVFSSLDDDAADLLATRSAALSHQADQLAEAAETTARGSLLLLRGEDVILARATARDRLHVVVAFDADTSPGKALTLVRQAARIAHEELSGDVNDATGAS